MKGPIPDDTGSSFGALHVREEHASAADVLITRRPIWRVNGDVRAYEVVVDQFEGEGNDAAGDLSSRTMYLLAHVIDIQAIMGTSALLFVPASRTALSERSYMALPPDRTVLTVAEDGSDVTGSNECIEAQRHGYAIAVELPGETPDVSLGRGATYVKAPVSNALSSVVNTAHSHGGRVVATEVNDKATWHLARNTGCDLYTGTGLHDRDIYEAREIRGIHSVHVKLLAELGEPVLNRNKIADIVESDLALAHALLRRINSAAAGVRQRVSSVLQALALLGDDQVRAWGSLTVLSALKGRRPSELVIASLVRARYCASLGGATGHDDQAIGAYLVGLLSKLDVILGIPMDKAVEALGLSTQVARVLLGARDTPVGDFLTLADACERGAWSTVLEVRARLGLSQSAVAGEYYSAMVWVHKLIELSA